MMPCDRGAEKIMKILKRAMRLADKAGRDRTKDARNIILNANVFFCFFFVGCSMFGCCKIVVASMAHLLFPSCIQVATGETMVL